MASFDKGHMESLFVKKINDIISKIVGKSVKTTITERGSYYTISEPNIPGWGWSGCNTIRFSITDETTGYTICDFFLSTFPGCCGIMISHNTYVDPIYRKKGISKILQTLKEEIAIETGFSLLLAVDLENSISKDFLPKFKWYEIGKRFKNKRSGNELLLFAKNV